MKLIILSPEMPHEMESEIYSRTLSEQRISHIHLRRKTALTSEEWESFRPFSNKMVFSTSCGSPPFPVLGMHGKTSDFSSSAHSIEEASKSTSIYCYISPLYPSISKQNYQNEKLLQELIDLKSIPKNWVALGGITTSRLPELKKIGFDNAAVLGGIWQSPNPIEAYTNLINAL